MVSDKNIISVNGLRGDFPPPHGNFIGHDRELNHRKRELSGNAGGAATMTPTNPQPTWNYTPRSGRNYGGLSPGLEAVSLELEVFGYWSGLAPAGFDGLGASPERKRGMFHSA